MKYTFPILNLVPLNRAGRPTIVGKGNSKYFYFCSNCEATGSQCSECFGMVSEYPFDDKGHKMKFTTWAIQGELKNQASEVNWKCTRCKRDCPDNISPTLAGRFFCIKCNTNCCIDCLYPWKQKWNLHTFQECNYIVKIFITELKLYKSLT